MNSDIQQAQWVILFFTIKLENPRNTLSNGYQEEISLGAEVVTAQIPVCGKGQEYFQHGHKNNCYLTAYLQTTECCFPHITTVTMLHC
jgi:hypothetical protein